MQKEKVVKLTKGDLDFLTNKMNGEKWIGLLSVEECNLIFELYKLALRTRYLAYVMNNWDLKDSRVKAIQKKSEMIRQELAIHGISRKYFSISNTGINCVLVLERNRVDMNIYITDDEFNGIKEMRGF